MIDYSKHNSGKAFEQFTKDVAKINVSPPNLSQALACMRACMWLNVVVSLRSFDLWSHAYMMF